MLHDRIALLPTRKCSHALDDLLNRRFSPRFAAATHAEDAVKHRDHVRRVRQRPKTASSNWTPTAKSSGNTSSPASRSSSTSRQRQVVFAHGGNPTGVDEINRDKKTVWTYVSKCPQVLGCQRLDNGNTLVAEQGPCQAVEVNPKGEIVHVTKMTTTEEAYHRQVRSIHKLDNGHILAAHEGEGAIREYDPDGKVVWEYTERRKLGDAVRLDNGNTLISCGTQKRLIEVTPAGKIVWEFGAKDAPELNLTWVGSLQILKNGHYVVGNFLRGQEGKAPTPSR